MEENTERQAGDELPPAEGAAAEETKPSDQGDGGGNQEQPAGDPPTE